MSSYKPLEIFTTQYLHELKNLAEQDLSKYQSSSVDFDKNGVVATKIKVPDTAPSLDLAAESDYENAIKVYEYLSNLDDSSACDERVWAYLAHVVFREHLIGRWPFDIDNPEKALVSIKDHWFYGQRGLVRHGIARLWWGAHMSVAPWEDDEDDDDFYRDIDKTDRYRYTKILFSKSVIFQQIMEREQTRPPKIRVALYEYIYDKNDISKEEINYLAKRIDMASSYKKLDALNYSQLRDLIDGFVKY